MGLTLHCSVTTMQKSSMPSTESLNGRQEGREAIPAECHLRVLLFSMLRERVGQGELRLVLPAPAKGTDVLDELERRHPGLGAYRGVIRLAVNQEYVSSEHPLSDGDEVALITPVSGG